jgi:serine/threonine-protein kinase
MPERFGPWLLVQPLARGGMAEVFLAERADDPDAPAVCIKRVLPEYLNDAEFTRMFLDEARLSQHLDHDNIVRVLGSGDVDGRLWLSMDYIDGTTLEQVLELVIRRRAAVPPPAAVAVGVQLCRGLRHAHTLHVDGRPQGVVHRDVSPANVLLTWGGEVKLTDFGVARARDRLVRTRPGTTKGKEPWMSPEQARGDRIDHRSDQFAVGILLWEMLAGGSLFGGGRSADILARVVQCEVPVPSSRTPGVPRALDLVVGRALAPRPADRFTDMDALEQALLACGYDEQDGRAALVELIEETVSASPPTQELRRPSGVVTTPAARPPRAPSPPPISWLRVLGPLLLGGAAGVLLALVVHSLSS